MWVTLVCSTMPMVLVYTLLYSLSPSVLPKCYPPLPQLFLKQRQQASGTKELLTKCKVIPQPDRCPSLMSQAWSLMSAHNGLSSPWLVLSFICSSSLLGLGWVSLARLVFMKTWVSWPQPRSGPDYLHTSPCDVRSENSLRMRREQSVRPVCCRT